MAFSQAIMFIGSFTPFSIRFSIACAIVGAMRGRITRPTAVVKSENFIDVVVEEYFEWDVEKSGLKGEFPQIKGMTLVDDLMAYIERKLFTLNTGHCITAYLGNLRGIPTIDKAIADEEIFGIVSAAMKESGDGLIKKYGFDPEKHAAYIKKIISRFKNPYLQDDVTNASMPEESKMVISAFAESIA